jgi:hypothetical protein
LIWGICSAGHLAAVEEVAAVGVPEPERGRDLEIDISIPFQLAVMGGEYPLSLQHDGKTERIMVKIPPGVDSGSRIRLAGQGEAGTQGGPAGDLHLKVQVIPHPYFRREGKQFVSGPAVVDRGGDTGDPSRGTDSGGRDGEPQGPRRNFQRGETAIEGERDSRSKDEGTRGPVRRRQDCCPQGNLDGGACYG